VHSAPLREVRTQGIQAQGGHGLPRWIYQGYTQLVSSIVGYTSYYVLLDML